jgi:WD40 repeat protein
MHRLEVFRTPQLRWGIKSLAFSPDGKYLAVGKMDRKLLMFDVEKGAAVATIDDLRAISSISSLAFTHDGAKLVAGGSTGIIHCYAVGDDGDLRQTGSFAGHASEIHCLAVSPDNRLVLSGDQDKRLRCWSLESCREQWVIADFTGRAQAVCFTKEGAEGLVTDGKMLLRIDLDSGTVTSSRKIAGFSHSSAFSPDGQYVSTCDGRTIRTFDTSTAKELSVCETDEIQWAMCSSPDGKQLAAGGNNLLSIVEVESGKRVAALPLAGIGYSHAVAWSADGRYAAGIGQSQRIASVFAIDKLDQLDAESP